MLKYLFLVFILVGCSNEEISKQKEYFETKDEKHLLVKAANLYSLGKKNEALLIYDSILKINNKNLNALREKAIIEAQIGNFNNTEKDLLKVLSINSKDSLVLKNLAYLNFNKKNYKKSFEYLNRIPNEEKSDEDYFICGYIEFINKNYKESLNYYEKIENEKIFNDVVFFESYLDNLKKIKNVKDFSLLKIEKKVINSRLNTIKLSQYYSQFLKRDDLAEKILKNYLTLNRIDDEVVNELIKLYYKNGDKEKVKKASNLISKDYR
ncbi:MAG: tetratricopeptide repeat protein [Cetobacterium sp.]